MKSNQLQSHSRENEKSSRRHLQLVNPHHSANLHSKPVTIYLTLARIFYLIGILGTIGLVQRLAGRPVGEILHFPAFFGVVGLTYLVAARNLGFKITSKGFLKCILGAGPSDLRDLDFQRFAHSIPSWTISAAHVCAMIGMLNALYSVEDLARLGQGIATAYCSYLYAGVLVLLLPQELTHGNKPSRLPLKKEFHPLLTLLGGITLAIFAITAYRFHF